MADIFLVEFKGHRREYCVNTFHHQLSRGEGVITDANPGEDFGFILHRWDETGPLRQKHPPSVILRAATEVEKENYKRIRPRELAAKAQARALARRMGLEMKLSDVESLFDGSKMVFFYTAEHRVDFRGLVRELAVTFRTWIEMRQISPREESRRVGDCGMCGGEVCCRRANLTNIQVGTQDARDQDLQINLSKLTGLCGKLRCCLTFERDQYIDTKRMFPGRGAIVETPAGYGKIEKIDVFKEEAVVRLEDGSPVRVSPNQVRRAPQHRLTVLPAPSAQTDRDESNDDDSKNGGRQSAAQTAIADSDNFPDAYASEDQGANDVREQDNGSETSHNNDSKSDDNAEERQ